MHGLIDTLGHAGLLLARSSWQKQLCLFLLVLLTTGGLAQTESPRAKKFKTITNEQALEMLATVKADLKEHYYDATMHGVDLDKRFDKARQEIEKARSQDEALLDIAGALASLDDSHTRLIPPVRPYGVDYGWIMQAIGDSNCFVTAVRPESDAALKGLKPGDQVVSINGIKITRQDLETIEYSYRVFPQSGLHVEVLSPQGVERSITAMAKVIPGQEIVRGIDVREWLRSYHARTDRSRYSAIGNRVLLWELPDFVINPAEVDGLLNKARSYDTLILDLRGNPGGLRATLDKFIGGFFDHDVKVGEMIGRKEPMPDIAKSRGSKAFKGKLIVLIDSKSGSAAEIFARVVQLEKRGSILGDRSAGAVMEAQDYVHAVKLDATNVAQYSARITVANLIMSDGKSLERAGVSPDESVLPTPADLAAGRDPALARAIELTGTKITAEDAGKILPFQWPKEQMPEID